MKRGKFYKYTYTTIKTLLLFSVFAWPFNAWPQIIPKDQFDKSRVDLESEDRESKYTQAVVDSTDTLNLIINNALDEVRDDLSFSQEEELTTDQINIFLQKVYRRLGRNIDGSGIVIRVPFLKFEFSPLVAIEKEIIEKFNQESEIVRVPFSSSRYGKNPVGLLKGKEWSHKTKTIADHSIAPTIRVGEVLIGIDKLGHFFQQGYWYEDSGLEKAELINWGGFLEGDTELPESSYETYIKVTKKYCKSCAKFGYFGSYSTGVISYADIDANIYGYEFFQLLRADPWMKFDIRAWNLNKLNENHNPSKFNDGLEVEAEAECCVNCC